MTSLAAEHPVSSKVFGPAAEPVDRAWVGPPHRGSQPLVRATHPDKAISQRATVLAAMCEGESTIHALADCRDVRRNLDVVAALGVPLRATGPASITVTGRHPSSWRASGLTLDAGNSATTSRLLVAVLAGSGARCVVTGNDLLRTRPMSEVAGPLGELGADLAYLDAPGRLPIRVNGSPLRGGTVVVAVDSAQPVSALLFAGTNAAAPVTIHRRTAARDHTERLLRWTGVEVIESDNSLTVRPGRPSPFSLTVPGDPSGAAFLGALHVASPRAGAALAVPGVGFTARRTGFFDVLRAMGVVVWVTSTADTGPEPVGTVTLRRPGTLAGTQLADPGVVQSVIDEIPLLAALATVATGPTQIRNAGELRGKDTDRIAETVALLRAFGCHAQPTDDGLLVHPGPPSPPAVVDLVADHRLIFAAMVLSVLCGGGVELRGVAAAATSHPGALADLAQWAPVEAR